MRFRCNYTVVLLTCFAIAGCGGGSGGEACDNSALFEQATRLQSFYKGNTHTHSNRSIDSTAPVEDMIAWYRQRDYNFIVLTDHDFSSIPDEFAAEHTADFIVVAGEEVTSIANVPDGSFTPVHVNAICSNGATVGGTVLDGANATLIDAVDRILDISQAVPQVNHPNLYYALTVDDIMAEPNARLLEIANQHFLSNNAGDADHLSTEQIWDVLLSENRRYFGIASDDSHTTERGQGVVGPPGKAWVQVAAPVLTAANICTSLNTGSFYSSTGVDLAGVDVSGGTMELEISPAPGAAESDYSTEFIGRDGRVVRTSAGLTPSYQLVGSERYVRARVSGPNGKFAWTQPSFVAQGNACAAP